MGMMLLRIKLFFHACIRLVYSIFSQPLDKNCLSFQEKNDQAFLITR